MSSEASELLFLTQTLRAQIEWQRQCGTLALAPCSPEQLAERRQRYRDFSPAPEPLEEGSSAAEMKTLETAPAPLPAAPAPARAVTAAPSAPATDTRTPTKQSIGVTPGARAAVNALDAFLDLGRYLEPEARSSQPRPSAAALSPEQRGARLQVLADEIKGCTRCRLSEGRTQTVFARGNGSSGVCFVGEGPGQDEDIQGFPFVGPAGQLLDKMIAGMGLGRDEVYVCNIVKCRPPKNRKPEPDEMAACKNYLTEQLELVQPKVIVALGAVAVQGLLGVSTGITRLRGKWKLYGGRIPLMPTFHPAYLLRQPSAKREVWEDLQHVLTRIGLTVPTRNQ